MDNLRYYLLRRCWLVLWFSHQWLVRCQFVWLFEDKCPEKHKSPLMHSHSNAAAKKIAAWKVNLVVLVVSHLVSDFRHP